MPVYRGGPRSSVNQTGSGLVQYLTSLPLQELLGCSRRVLMLDPVPTVVQRFVNPASAGGAGTRAALSGANAAYASLNAGLAAEVAVRPDLVSRNELLWFRCSGTTAADTTRPVFSASWRADGARYLRITGEDGALGPKVWSTRYQIAAAVPSGGAAVVDVTVPFTRLENIQVLFSWPANAGGHGVRVGAAGVQLLNVVSKQTSSRALAAANEMGAFAFTATTGVPSVAVNCLAVGCSSSESDGQGFYHVSGGVKNLLYNCLAYGCDTGFWEAGTSGATVLKNCVVAAGFNVNYFGTFASTSANNLSSDTTSPGAGTGNVSSLTFTFVNAAADDYHWASGDTGARGRGTDLSADAGYAFATDADGEARGATWDAGPDQYVASGSNDTSATGGLVASGPALSGSADESSVATGALVAGGSALSGSASESTTATGSLVAAGSALSGAASETTTATGTLTAGGSALTGSASESSTASGSLVAGGSALSGAASESSAATGALVAGGSALAGSAAESLSATGSLVPAGGALTGTAAESDSATGTLTAAGSALAGTGSVANPNDTTATGALAASGAGLSGSAAESDTASGTLAASGTALGGTAAESDTATGALDGVTSALSGTADESATATGGLVASGSALLGTANVPNANDTTATGQLTAAGGQLGGSVNPLQGLATGGDAAAIPVPGGGTTGVVVVGGPMPAVHLHVTHAPSAPDERATPTLERPALPVRTAAGVVLSPRAQPAPSTPEPVAGEAAAAEPVAAALVPAQAPGGSTATPAAPTEPATLGGSEPGLSAGGATVVAAPVTPPHDVAARIAAAVSETSARLETDFARRLAQAVADAREEERANGLAALRAAVADAVAQTAAIVQQQADEELHAIVAALVAEGIA